MMNVSQRLFVSQDLPFLIIESKEFQDMVQLLSMHVPEIMDELRPLAMYPMYLLVSVVCT